MKVLVLGLNPSRRLGKSGSVRTLYSWLDQLNLEVVSFDNIYDGYEKFSLKDVKREYVREITKEYDRVLALGSKVSDVLNLMGINHFKLPHPSGLNRQLNNLELINNTLVDCNRYIWT